jgi:hypothetical protein
MQYVAVVVAVVLVVIAAIVLLRGGSRDLPKLPRVPLGGEIGAWKMVYDPDAKELGLTHTFPAADRARFVVYFVEDMLFYYQWGAKQYDTSREVRPALEAALRGEAEWRVTDRTTHGPSGNTFDGTMYEHGISRPRVLGWSKQNDARPLGLAALVAQAVTGPEGDRVKKAVETLVAWYTQYGPTTKPSFDRATAAWSGIAPLA